MKSTVSPPITCGGVVARVRVQSWFVASAGAMFLLVGLAKIASSLETSEALKVTDPLLNIQFGALLLMVGLVECAVASFCFMHLPESGSLKLVACVSSMILVYRLGVALIGWKRPCACLGSITQVLGITERVGDGIAIGLLVYILTGSFLLLVTIWFAQRQKPELGATNE